MNRRNILWRSFAYYIQRSDRASTVVAISRPSKINRAAFAVKSQKGEEEEERRYVPVLLNASDHYSITTTTLVYLVVVVAVS